MKTNLLKKEVQGVSNELKIIERKRRKYGEHLTSIDIFNKYILPEIKDIIYNYAWFDLFAGEGNLILPILNLVPKEKRSEFFKKRIFLFDAQEEMIKKSITNATRYGIPEEIARKNIIRKDTLKEYPVFASELPVYHITNPPYLYIGYIVKHKETQRYLEYFKGRNEGYQDLYQLALMNDLRYRVKKMVYIIPSNFLFGFSVSNKIRNNFLTYYNIEKAFIFERKIFKYTGTNVIICFFERKKLPKKEPISFAGFKLNKTFQKRWYNLSPENYYRAGNEFEEFVKKFKANRPLNINYYLTIEEVEENRGDKEIEVIDANAFDGNRYKKNNIFVNEQLYEKIKSNILFVRTVDTGSINGKAGVYLIKDVFNVDGILVTKARYRTHPIQIFIKPELSIKYQIILKEYFNLLMEYFREITDSEFMTTYKYSNGEYTRKYLGLLQIKELIETFPILTLSKSEVENLKSLIGRKDAKGLILFLKNVNKKKRLL